MRLPRPVARHQRFYWPFQVYSGIDLLFFDVSAGGKIVKFVPSYWVSTVLQTFKMAIASSLPALFISQLPGVMVHGTQAAMMVVSLETGERDRTANLAYLNLSYGAGLITGGVVGATMANWFGPRGTLIVASAMELCGCLLAFSLGKSDASSVF